jgi:hypothetical protein
VLRLKVRVSELAVHLRVRSRYSESNTSKHVVGSDPVYMVLVDLGTHNDAIVIFVLFALPLAGPFLPDVLGPPRGIVILRYLLEMHVRVYRPRSPPRQRHGTSTACRCVG